jgi:large subunit ribosomal protein L15
MRKRRRHIKFLGSRTHGVGSHKKHRGKGSRGGKGYAGSTGHRFTWLVKYEPDHLGKMGFKSLGKRNIIKKPKAINIGDIQKLTAESEIDAKKLGYDKILGKGEVSRPLVVKADFFSGKARKKIENAGGKAMAPQTDKKD